MVSTVVKYIVERLENLIEIAFIAGSARNVSPKIFTREPSVAGFENNRLPISLERSVHDKSGLFSGRNNDN